MAHCEDYPCCGHEEGGCPIVNEDGSRQFECCTCGGLLPVHHRSAMCDSCLRSSIDDDDEYGGGRYEDEDEDEVALREDEVALRDDMQAKKPSSLTHCSCDEGLPLHPGFDVCISCLREMHFEDDDELAH